MTNVWQMKNDYQETISYSLQPTYIAITNYISCLAAMIYITDKY